MAGSLESLQIVLDKLYEHDGEFNYNVIKRHLSTNPEFVQDAKKVFSVWDVESTEGYRILCSVIQFLVLIKTATIFKKKVIEVL